MWRSRICRSTKPLGLKGGLPRKSSSHVFWMARSLSGFADAAELRKAMSSGPKPRRTMTEMSEEARAAAIVLLAHHREVCRPVKKAAEEISDDLVNDCALTYGIVCERAKMPD